MLYVVCVLYIHVHSLRAYYTVQYAYITVKYRPPSNEVDKFEKMYTTLK